MATFTLKSYHFRREREAGWRELEELLARADRGGLAALSAAELYRLPALYRGALSSLSVARAISLDKNVVAYLESLTARAYLHVYGSKRDFLTTLEEFFRHRFPALVWSMRGGLAAALLLLALGIAGGYLLTTADAERFYSLVSDEVAGGRSPASSRDELLAVLKSGRETEGDVLAAFSSVLFSHNARIGLGCFALGFAAGVPVALLVLWNGLALGAFVAIHARQGLALEFWAWVLPHGVTELLAVVLCAAAGFAVGHAFLFPGRHPRLESLARRGREAAAVVGGAVALFFVAALLEGFFRQWVHGEVPRLAVALATAVFWVWYFGRPAWGTAGRREP